MNPFSHTGLSISDSLKSVRKSVLIYETIIQTGIGTCNLSGSRNGDVSFVGSFRCTDGVMALINVPVILILSELAFKAVQDYEAQLKKGINPVFKSADVGLSQKTDFWR